VEIGGDLFNGRQAEVHQLKYGFPYLIHRACPLLDGSKLFPGVPYQDAQKLVVAGEDGGVQLTGGEEQCTFLLPKVQRCFEYPLEFRYRFRAWAGKVYPERWLWPQYQLLILPQAKSVLGFWSSSRKLAIFWLDETRKPEFSLS
jgi:hypothetical protein